MYHLRRPIYPEKYGGDGDILETGTQFISGIKVHFIYVCSSAVYTNDYLLSDDTCVNSGYRTQEVTLR